MSLIKPDPESPIVLSAPNQGDVFLQIGKVSTGPALQVSSEVLFKYFKRFGSYNFESRSAEEPFIFVEEDDHCGMVLLMSIAHSRNEVIFPVTFEDLKKAAEYAHKFGYQSSSRPPKWLSPYLLNQLPPDSAGFPDASLRGHPNGCFKRILDVLCIALVFNCPEEFSRASRELTWIMRPTDLINWLHFDLTQVISNDFRHDFGKANDALRLKLMSNLPAVFYPDPHGNEHGPCLKCNSTPHETRWYWELTLRNANWNDELAELNSDRGYYRASGSL